MSSRTLLLILVGISILGTLFYTTAPSDTINADRDAKSLLPDVSGEDVRKIVIEKGVEKAEVAHLDGSWIVPARSSYAADPEKVQALLLKLLSMRLTQEVATLTTKFDALGVSDTAVSDGMTKVSLLGDGDAELATVYLGKERSSSGAPGAASGQYIRRKKGKRVYLISEPLSFPAVGSEWLNATVVNVLASRVQKIVQASHAENGVNVEFTLVRPEQIGDAPAELQFQGTVADTEQVHGSILSQVGSGLQGVRVADVRAAPTEAGAISSVTYYHLSNGAIYAVTLYDDPSGKTYMSLLVTLDENVVTSVQAAKATLSESVAELEKEMLAAVDPKAKKKKPTAEANSKPEAKEGKDVTASAEDERKRQSVVLAKLKKQLSSMPNPISKEEVEKLNTEYAKWQYQLPSFVSARFSHTRADLVQEKSEQNK